MNSEEITTCPICENENFELYLNTIDYTATKESFELRQCTRCQFLITSPRPTENYIAKYYATENYISHSGNSKSLFDKIYVAARSITLKWKYQLIKEYASTPGHILDYGCGTGEFLNLIKDKGYHIHGVEPNDTARQKANQKLQGKVVENLHSIKNNSIDTITLWHVLEHVHHLNETIQNLKNLLSQNGHLFIAVPNYESHDAANYKNTWAGYDVPRHLWHFSQNTMHAILRKNGLDVIDVKPMKLDSYYVSLLSEQYKNPSQNKIITGIKAIIEGIHSNRIAKKKNQYSSLIYIARPV